MKLQRDDDSKPIPLRLFSPYLILAASPFAEDDDNLSDNDGSVLVEDNRPHIEPSGRPN
jgi:hypothetical protein